MRRKSWFVYILKCSDDTLYTGITTDIARRIWEHSNGLGAKSLKGKLPVRIVYKETHPDQKKAAKREREIKGWRREKKLKLINSESGFTLKSQSD